MFDSGSNIPSDIEKAEKKKEVSSVIPERSKAKL
jgi:hypothetical protein